MPSGKAHRFPCLTSPISSTGPRFIGKKRERPESKERGARQLMVDIRQNLAQTQRRIGCGKFGASPWILRRKFGSQTEMPNFPRQIYCPPKPPPPFVAFFKFIVGGVFDDVYPGGQRVSTRAPYICKLRPQERDCV